VPECLGCAEAHSTDPARPAKPLPL
jgi:hypothetical protein